MAALSFVLILSDYSFTNNYAVYPLARHFFPFLRSISILINRLHHNRLAPHQVRYIDLPLSVTHKHPASINTLRKCLQAADWDPQALCSMVGSYVERARTVSCLIRWPGCPLGAQKLQIYLRFNQLNDSSFWLRPFR